MESLTVVCPNCKTKNLPGRLHCLRCAVDLSALQPTEEEIRLVGMTAESGIAHPSSHQANELAKKVVGWYRLYCLTLLFLWLIVTPVLIGLIFLTDSNSMNGVPISMIPPDFVDSMRQQQQERMLAALGPTLLFLIPAVIAVIVALSVSPSPGSWVFHIVIICIGLSGCTLPVSVLLLIHWTKPEVQAYFGRRAAT